MTKMQGALLVSFFALFFYQWGATNLEGLLNYPFWRDMGRVMANNDFIQLRANHVAKIFPLVVIPFFLALAVTISLVFAAPAFIPRWQLLVVAGLHTAIALSTILLQIPIQAQLSRTGYDAAAFDRLIMTDVVLRKIPAAGEAVFVLLILWRVVMRV